LRITIPQLRNLLPTDTNQNHQNFSCLILFSTKQFLKVINESFIYRFDFYFGYEPLRASANWLAKIKWTCWWVRCRAIYEWIISFQIANEENVSLKLYDVLGREVKTIFNGQLKAGLHNVELDASSLASGIYIYKLNAGKYNANKKLQLIK
jgi:hypothetical protein